MTAIVGLICRDGLVIAADSQESDEEMGMKRLDVVKVYDTSRFHFEDVEIIVAGTGAVGYIARAAELIEEKGFAPHFTTPRTVANIVEESMGEMKDRYGEDLDLELMMGVYCKNCPKDKDGETSPKPLGLFSITPPGPKELVGVAEPVTDYTAMGSGGLFARYLLNRLHDEENPTDKLTMGEAINEAIYVMGEVTKVDLWCGGPTQLFCINKEGSTYKLERKKPPDIQQIVTELAKADEAVKKAQRQMFAAKPSASRKSKGRR